MSQKIAFIGAGRMASAIVKGLLEASLFSASDIYCTCGNDATGIKLSEATGIQFVENLEPHIETIDFLVLACKPQQLPDLELPFLDKLKHLTILSILAGTPIHKLRKAFPLAQNIIRSMPNTPGQIGEGVTAYAPEKPLSNSDTSRIESILGALGSVYCVSESQLDAVTAISGSGPAYVFEFISALTESGKEAGLEAELAQALAEKTVLGSSLLLKESQLSPDALRDAVTSPGGTTEAALKVLNEAHFRAMVQTAVMKAKARSEELAQN
jgi:pyrroline-5-carboxylate reductase